MFAPFDYGNCGLGNHSTIIIFFQFVIGDLMVSFSHIYFRMFMIVWKKKWNLLVFQVPRVSCQVMIHT